MESAKEIVRSKLLIQDIIGSYVSLVPVGNHFKACCPFHHEKTPSFNINTERQMFYCFGCKKGGDVFTFIQEIEHVDFKDALKMLAERAGVNLMQSKELAEEALHKKKMYDIHEYATRYYQVILSKNNRILEYLIDRGITRESIKKWRIGFAPDGFQNIVPTLRTKKFSDNELVSSGIAVRNEKGNVYERFRGRIMFPITDQSGKVIAFSGRVAPGTKESEREGVGKYINSPETDLYHKSKALFGWSYAKNATAKVKKIILVEGQFDAILVHQSGYEYVVALSGTASTVSHIEQLARFADEFIIATDNDYAGIQSAKKIAEAAYTFEKSISIIPLPEGKDPADVIRGNPDEWNQMVESRKDFIEFYITTQQNKEIKEKIQSVQNFLFPVIALIQNDIYRDAQLQKIASILAISFEGVRNEFQKFIRNLKIPPETIIIEQGKSNESSVFDPVTIQLKDLVFLYRYQADAKNWFDRNLESLHYIQNHFDILTESDIPYYLVRYKNIDTETLEKKLESLWNHLQIALVDNQIRMLTMQLKEKKTVEDISVIQKEIIQLTQKKEMLNSVLLD